MPNNRMTNFDYYVSSAGLPANYATLLEEFREGLGLVRAANNWSPTFHHRSVMTNIPDVDGADRFFPTEQCLTCDQCGNTVHESDRVSNAGRNSDVVLCSAECSDKWATDNGYVLVKHGSHGDYHQWFKIGQNEGQLASYSSIQENGFETSEDHPFLVGMEIEKEDYSFHSEGDDTDILSDALSRQWLAVSDGSLDECCGFELVSPAFNLTADDGLYGRKALERDLKQWDAINADSSSSCGGHITVSCKGLTGPQLAARLEPLFPVLFALYPSRVAGEYASAVRGENATLMGRKMRAVNTLENRVEFRLFSAVETGRQQLKRIDVLRQALLCIIGDNGLLSEQEARDELSGSIANRDSALWLSIMELVCDTKGSASDASRLDRIAGFQGWYATGNSNDTIRRYLR